MNTLEINLINETYRWTNPLKFLFSKCFEVSRFSVDRKPPRLSMICILSNEWSRDKAERRL